MFVLHACDEPSCINPNHLSVGSAKTNAQDALKRNRNYTGTKNPRARLSEQQVLEIKNSNFKTSYLMKKYNMARSTIRYIRIGKLWKHLNAE